MSTAITVIMVVFAYVGFVTTIRAIENSVAGQAFAKVCRENGITLNGCLIVVFAVIPSIYTAGLILWAIGEKLIGLLK